MEDKDFASWTDYRECVRAQLTGAQSTLWIQDADLSALDLESSAMHALFKACVMRLRPDGMRIVLQNAEPLRRQMPRTRELLVNFGHIAQVRVAAERDHRAMECALSIADGQILLTRPQHTLPRGVLAAGAADRAKRYSAQIETIWEGASDANIGAALGL